MKDMDIDMIIEIPDTPDKLPTCGRNCPDGVGKERITSVATESGNFCSTGEIATENGKSSRHHSHSQKYLSGEIVCKNNPHLSSAAPLFRRADKNLRRESNQFINPQRMETGKGLQLRSTYGSSACPENGSTMNVNQEKGDPRLHGIVFTTHSNCPTNSDSTKEVKELCTARNGSSLLRDSQCKASANGYKGKEKIGDISCRVSGSAVDRKEIGLPREPQSEKQDSIALSHRPVVAAKVSGHKRLVRNGCISPHAIATKGKQVNGLNRNGFEDSNMDRIHTESSDLERTSEVDIREIIAAADDDGDDMPSKAKGKAKIVHPHTSRSTVVDIVDSPRRYVNRETFGLNGWRSTHNQQRNTRVHPFPHIDKPHSALRPEPAQSNERKTVKRRRENGLLPGDQTACASAVTCEPGSSFTRSSGEVSSSRPSKLQNRQKRRMLDTVVEINDSPGTPRQHSREDRRCDNNESDARARQLEADEILARELQEQLYQDSPAFGDEIDANIAWAMQEEENASHSSSSHDHRVRRPAASNQTSRRRTRSQLLQRLSGRRVTESRAPSGRATRTRGRTPSAAFRRGRNLRFPTDMGLDARLDILEELEAAVQNLSHSMGMDNHILPFERDFNLDDYEMLLALDENNHQHARASDHQINSLPQSTVQTDNFEEACAICLETPARGDIIRHLPCLHKFHKDCIDPWLGRSKSCPVCKSSIP